MPGRSVRPSTAPAAVSNWITDRVAYYLRCPAAEIEPEVPLTAYGLDSMHGLSLCGEIETAFEVYIDLSVVWDIDTVAGLASYVSGLAAADRA
jgi:acyl carrier protein